MSEKVYGFCENKCKKEVLSLEAAKKDYAPKSHNHEGEYVKPHAIEFKGSSDAKNPHGGLLDFHFNANQAVDYTTRLVELAAGFLTLQNSSGSHDLVTFSSIASNQVDSVNVSGLYRLTGIPGLLLHLQWDVNYAVQIYHSSTDNTLKARQKSNGTWSDSKTICNFV